MKTEKETKKIKENKKKEKEKEKPKENQCKKSGNSANEKETKKIGKK